MNSPRPSTTPSSPRISESTDASAGRSATTANVPERGSLRRNRAALRNYYGLKSTSAGDGQDPSEIPSESLTSDLELESELDKAGFDPNAYVQHLLAHESLEGLLAVEASVVGDVRALDGEKKALVYDNYSKLIAATDTIRSMREKMDPMTLTTSTLSPAMGHIAETASSLAKDLRTAQASGTGGETENLRQEKATVRWVLASPGRIQKKMDEGNSVSAEQEWERVSALLDKWQGTDGTDEIRRSCLAALHPGEIE